MPNHRVFIGIGSNIEPDRHVREALQLLSRSVRLSAISTFYRTRAIGATEQPDYINGVVLAETDKEARALKFNVLRGIEDKLGRVRTADKCAARTIDLDILLFDDAIIKEADLVIPDPVLWERAFLAAGVVELDPRAVPPDKREQLTAVACEGRAAMVSLVEFTMELRKEFCNE